MLRLVGGVDLQQEAPADAEGAAAIQNHRVLAGAADLQAAVEAGTFTAGHKAQRTGGIQACQRLNGQIGTDAQLQTELVVGVGRDHGEVAFERER